MKKEKITVTVEFLNEPSEEALIRWTDAVIDMYDRIGYKYMNEEAKEDKES